MKLFIDRAKERLSCFISISNVENLSAATSLKNIKSRPWWWRGLSLLNIPCMWAPMYLKNKDRMEAISYIILMALMIYIVMQKHARKSLENEEEPLTITESKTTFSPTGNKILKLLRPAKILCAKEGHVVVEHFLPENYHRLARVLNLIGLGLDVYIRRRCP